MVHGYASSDKTHVSFVFLSMKPTMPPLSAQENRLGQRAPGSLRWIYGRPTTLMPSLWVRSKSHRA